MARGQVKRVGGARVRKLSRPAGTLNPLAQMKNLVNTFTAVITLSGRA
jgi:hypothetical protein